MREIEPGVTIMSAPEPERWQHTTGSDIITYRLREMTDEAISRYGLTKYVGWLNDEKA